jgi:hypothetical protein
VEGYHRSLLGTLNIQHLDSVPSGHFVNRVQKYPLYVTRHRHTLCVMKAVVWVRWLKWWLHCVSHRLLNWSCYSNGGGGRMVRWNHRQEAVWWLRSHNMEPSPVTTSYAELRKSDPSDFYSGFICIWQLSQFTGSSGKNFWAPVCFNMHQSICRLQWSLCTCV